jgi:hypothetical protein
MPNVEIDNVQISAKSISKANISVKSFGTADASNMSDIWISGCANITKHADSMSQVVLEAL